jgi:hypothetical protein
MIFCDFWMIEWCTVPINLPKAPFVVAGVDGAEAQPH